MKIRKIAASVFAALMFSGAGGTALAAESISTGCDTALTAAREEQQPVSLAGDTLFTLEINADAFDIPVWTVVPLRATADALPGFKAIQNEDGSITVDSGKMRCTLETGEDSYLFVTGSEEGGGSPLSLGMAPYEQNGEIFAPLEMFNILLGGSAVTASGNVIRIDARGEGPDEMIPNPFQRFDTLEEAEAYAGFSLSLPKDPDLLRAVKDQLIEAVYGPDGNEMCIRKGTGAADVSGDHTDYPDVKTAGIFTLKGENGKYRLVTWSARDYSYSIRVGAPLNQFGLLGLAAAVARANPAQKAVEAVIVRAEGGSYLVAPVKGSAELSSSDLFRISADEIDSSRKPEAGDALRIVYDGGILESYPAQFSGIQSITLTGAVEEVVEAVIVRAEGGSYLVEPVKGSPELSSSDLFRISADEIGSSREPEAGDILRIIYDGGILETYPAQFSGVQSVTLADAIE